MTEDQIKHMVDRFLGWRLPEPWSPDNGISYKRPSFMRAPAAHDWPVGTNLFDATQADAMVRYMLEGMPAAPSEEAAFVAFPNIPQRGERTYSLNDIGPLLDRAEAAEAKNHLAWLIEAPGPHYLAARSVAGQKFYWTRDHNAALRFFSEGQADLAMMAIRELDPELFGFAVTLGDARPVEHGFIDG